jgi:hypothetical protein
LTLEELIIGLIRVAGSLPVLRWAFAGAVIAVLVDFSDLFFREWLDLGSVRNYQSFDKWLDLAYLATFLIVALRWKGVPRTVAVVLFLFRMAGVVTFELTGNRYVLLAFPNVFEFWFIGVAAQKHWWPDYRLRWKSANYWLLLALALKMGQEWTLHGGQYLEQYVVTELIGSWWGWLTGR